MNCRPGDIAVLVNARYEESIGALVEVISLDAPRRGLPTWKCRAISRIKCFNDILLTAMVCEPGTIVYGPDSYLRPIRDNDGTDEMLTIVGKPEKVAA